MFEKITRQMKARPDAKLHSFFSIAVLALAIHVTSHAAIPLTINHQGIVKVNGQPFNGNGLFKFGFVDDVTGLWLWTNDGTNIGQSASITSPSAAVTLPCASGIYNVRLGDTAFVNMTAIPSSVFDVPEVNLRVIFNDGTTGFQVLLPDQPLTANAFAYRSLTADLADDALLLEGLTAVELAVPVGFSIMGFDPVAPAGYSFTGITLGGAWSTRANMPTVRDYPVAAYVDGLAYVVGGWSGAYLATNDAYGPVTDTWVTRQPMPVGRDRSVAAVVNGIIYVIGGRNSGSSTLGTNEAYDPATNSWSTKAPMPTPRSNAAVAVVDGIIYVVGGAAPSPTTTNEAYDPVANTWSTKAPMPTARDGVRAASLNGIVYAIGGAGTSANENEAYDPVANSWSTKAVYPTAVAGLAVAGVGSRVFAMGGAWPPDFTRKNTHYSYDPVLDTWTAEPALLTSRAYTAVTVVNGGAILLFGGSITPTVLSDKNELFAPSLYVYSKD